MINTEIHPLVDKYNKVRAYTERICAPLQTEDYVPQPVPFASPPKWHLGHTTWFFEELILKANQPDYQIYDANFSFIFNSYYNSLGDRIFRAHRGNLTRPSVEEVYAYRKYVDEHLTRWLSSVKMTKPLEDLLVLGLNHEQQHQELLITDLKYTLGNNPLFPVYEEPARVKGTLNPAPKFLPFEEGVHEIGFSGEGFCYDNELGRHKVYIQPFEIRDTLVSNREYLEFIQDGGYERFEFWLDEGWSWVNENNMKAPMYWHEVKGAWHYYTLGGFKEVQPDEPVCHVSFFEAAAFAEWKGMRLPTEFEWEVASDHFDWGQRWEWTNSAYLPYPNFAKAPGAVGEYNGKFMINQMVLRGASVATSPDHSRNTYRNFFHTHFQWQFTGIRLAK